MRASGDIRDVLDACPIEQKRDTLVVVLAQLADAGGVEDMGPATRAFLATVLGDDQRSIPARIAALDPHEPSLAALRSICAERFQDRVEAKQHAFAKFIGG